METQKKLLKYKDVRTKLGGISTATLWRLQQLEDFPAPVVIRNAPYLIESELDQWIDAQPRASRTGVAS